MPFVVISYAPKVYTQSERTRSWGSPVRLSIIIIGFFACFHGRTESFQENRLFVFQAHVVLKPLVSLIGRLVTTISGNWVH